MPKLVWRVKLVAELRPGVMTETEVAGIERDEEASLADLGLRHAETRQLTAALQAEIVSAQVAVVGERRRCCPSCGHKLASKGHYPAIKHHAIICDYAYLTSHSQTISHNRRSSRLIAHVATIGAFRRIDRQCRMIR